jgi:hypothetical protein
MHFDGDRSAIREQAKNYALAELIALLRNWVLTPQSLHPAFAVEVAQGNNCGNDHR